MPDISDKLKEMINVFEYTYNGMPTEVYANGNTIKELVDLCSVEIGGKPTLPLSSAVPALYMGVRIMQEDLVPDGEFILV